MEKKNDPCGCFRLHESDLRLAFEHFSNGKELPDDLVARLRGCFSNEKLQAELKVLVACYAEIFCIRFPEATERDFPQFLSRVIEER
ncbi:MAG: hypothetical protein ACOX2O_07645 [Bdellovibrionota bacterium]|jgi:hypothetical protein